MSTKVLNALIKSNEELIRQEAKSNFIAALEQMFEEEFDFENEECKELTTTMLSVSEVVDILTKQFGATKGEMDTNGWQWDVWIPMYMPNWECDTQFMITSCGYYGGVTVKRFIENY